MHNSEWPEIRNTESFALRAKLLSARSTGIFLAIVFNLIAEVFAPLSLRASTSPIPCNQTFIVGTVQLFGIWKLATTVLDVPRWGLVRFPCVD